MKRPKFDPDIKLADLTAEDLICPDCGYNLRGLDATRCPECGLQAEDFRESQVPWTRRESIGWLRSIRLTARMGPQRLAFEVCRRQSLPEARRLYRGVLLLVGGMAVMTLALVVIGTKDVDLIWLCFFHACAYLATIAVVPLVAGKLVSPSGCLLGDRDRAKAVVMYNCARLHDLWLPAVCFLVGWICLRVPLPEPYGEMVPSILFMVGAPLVFFIWLNWLSILSMQVGLVSNHGWLPRQVVSLAIFAVVGVVVVILACIAFAVMSVTSF